ncbi:signal peptide peptidase SppA [Candidatus Synchoanobacter obligatus]|uniref:Signal peptide peptidase SppA n=1 Tax=Candidatus Synchoanobacter obligatus TaxID=2919597 RepID=A0ABT1L447_9GAMM|nr:signal peptide peptidase SppA [Candidatus Synchoanobacter obligatus]MCP8351959.1 signal peptide peptidase SppA [Candidatus Synchoanobacter obligatus]
MTKQEVKDIAEAVSAVNRRDVWHKRWRNLALLLLVVLLSQWFSRGGSQPEAKVLDHIAMIHIDEPISLRSEFWEQFEKVNMQTKAAIVIMNSPGGGIGDSERLYHEIAALNAKMPLTVLVENSATSGAYMGALGSDRIYAYNSSIIGSVGVVFSNLIVKELMEKIGIREEKITTGRYKGYPNSFEDMPAEVRQHLQIMLEEDNQWFLDLIVKRRGLNQKSVQAIKDAQVYAAKSSLSLGLIDGISTRQEQIAWLKEQVGDLTVKDLSIDESDHFGLSKFILKSQRRALKGMLSDLMLG